jgi:septum formation protein
LLEISTVTFRKIEPEEIDEYVRTGEPMDKAGAYAIQGGAQKFAARIQGDIDNIIGLPVAALQRALEEIGYMGS